MADGRLAELEDGLEVAGADAVLATAAALDRIGEEGDDPGAGGVGEDPEARVELDHASTVIDFVVDGGRGANGVADRRAAADEARTTVFKTSTLYTLVH